MQPSNIINMCIVQLSMYNSTSLCIYHSINRSNIRILSTSNGVELEKYNGNSLYMSFINKVTPRRIYKL